MLIITYTKNATQEIKKRLIKNIYNLYIDFSNKKTFNKNYKKIFKKTKNYKKAEKILRNAYLKINQAPIYTIHGFCKNILIKKNLNYEYSFSEKKIYDENYLYKKSTYNFWRNTFYQFNKKISNIVIKYWKTPNDLFQEILPWLKIKSKISIYIKKKKKNIIEIHQNNIKKIKNFKKKWKKNKKNIQKFFQRKNLNKRIYNKKNIQKWIKKIEKWRKKKTKNYFIPKELKHFKNKKINKNLKEKIKTKFKFFKNIEKFLKKNFSLRERILFYSIKKIKKIFIQISKKKFCFENLISSLNLELKKRKNLKKDLRKEFPIAFIDEFQDTDNKQYSIFKKIYKKKKNTSLILIGDPKQSIYNFRGADIFFYIKNKKKISNIYTLKTNWRSSKLLINGINKLFNRTKNIFLFKEIKYNLTIPSVYSDKIKFYIKNLEQKAIKFWLQKGKTNTISNYENWAAKICSQNINYLIQKIKKKQAILQNSNKKKFLKIKDICILVKNYKEFKKIQYELKKLNIGSYYTSYKKSIFKKNEVQEMYYILKSIVNLSNEYYFYRAISTLIIFKNSYIIYKIKKKYNIWSKLKNKFINYKKFWKKYGILNLIKEILSKSNIYKNYFFNNKNERKISNLIHLGEILEIKSKLRKNFCSLLLWFKKKIKKENEHNEQYYQKLSNNQKNIINITTIHKSKGLEYPIVWIPFISNFKFSKKYIFHNKKKYNCFINIEKLKKYIKFEEKERLSEDMRLLYVAMTRAIFQCNLGISPIIKKIKKKSKDKETDFHNSAIGYIIQKKKKMNSKKLKKEIIKITKEKNFELIKKIKIKKKKEIKKNNNKNKKF
ncbi:UvrD-helicase domain-containing protein [Buchnera aphidicola]|uniref:UvrD-helicase domain-containing protein n=1 Tax=Buchnera aphidicola TaxID=9 RepID=UPI0025B1D862|nr:UvrD-helicase domain-containing protein [Buchnera aphidicola]